MLCAPPMSRSFKKYFSRAFQAAPERLHFAAHSHHYWPDAALEGHARAGDLACEAADEKWSTVFGEVLPKARAHIAHILALPDPSTLAFAPNTHELFVRIISSLDRGAPLRVLSTDSEFHSFERQTRRWEEAGMMEVTRIPTESFDDFGERFLSALEQGSWDLIFASQVFFNSGFVNPVVEEITTRVRAMPQTILIIDGYHGFCALPTSLAAVSDRAFYMSGGYKYAMAGEGACFAHCPPGWAERPVNTGWFAGFGELSKGVGDSVQYAQDGMRMMGATFEPTPWLRFNAAWDLWAEEGVGIEEIHAHVAARQTRLIDGVASTSPASLTGAERLPAGAHPFGHFVTFRTERAGALHDALRGANVLTDYRGDRLRFGVALYHEDADIDRLLDVLGGLRLDGD